MSKSIKTTVSKITVKNVRVGDEVQSVNFVLNTAKGVVCCRTRNHTPIRVRFNPETKKFVAGNRSGNVIGKSAEAAFAKAATQIWVN